VAPPARQGEWEVRFEETDAARGWEELCRQAPANTFATWMTMRRSPVPPADSQRQHRLHHELGTGMMKGRALDRWQIEVTGAGRVWYLVDHDNRTVWIDHAGPGHPKATD
jgi:hypothetical protein